MKEAGRDGRQGRVPQTVEEARAVTRQGRPEEPRLPMGPMLDAGQLRLKDLRGAIETHYNPTVRTAAEILLAHIESGAAADERARAAGRQFSPGDRL